MHISRIPSWRAQRGFSITQIVLAIGLMGGLAAATVPTMRNHMGRVRAFAAAQDVVGQIRAARVTALSANTSVKVRFNCPSDGRYRFLDIAGGDDPSRCSAPDPKLTPGGPSNDGSPMKLPGGMKFVDVQDVSFLPSGDMITAGPMPARIEIAEDDGSNSREIVVTAAGNVELPEPPK